ncbi:HdeD family acid-resistance protein [Arthrobacter sp. GCM10027362]
MNIRPTKGSGTALIIRGVLAILFGVMVIAWPQATVLVLVVLFGVFAIADGITAIIHWAAQRRGGRRLGWLLAGGIVSVLAGIVALAWPGPTALAVSFIIGVWALLLGISQIVLSVAVRRVVPSWWLGLLAGILAVLIGLLLVIVPGAGILGFLGFLAAFAWLFGVVLIAAGIRTRQLAKRLG